MPYTTNNFPTSIQNPTNPVANDDTDSFDHAGLESFQNDSIKALKDKVGADGSAVTTSLDYKLKNTSSLNPGHKHTLANGATDVTATAAEVNKLAGMTTTSAQFGYLSTTTSDVQTQINGKANTSHTHSGSDITSGTVGAARLGGGTADSTTYLRGDNTWSSISIFIENLDITTPNIPSSYDGSNIHVGCDNTQTNPTYLWFSICDSTTIYIYRLDRQTSGNYIYKGVNTSFTASSGALCGITETGGYVYVTSVKTSNIMACDRYATDLTGATTMTGGFVGQVYAPCGQVSDPVTSNKIWRRHTGSSFTDVGGYTISGTTFTRSNTITLSVAVSNDSDRIIVDSSGNIYFAPQNPSLIGTIQKYNSSGTAQTSITSSWMYYVLNNNYTTGWVKIAGKTMIVNTDKATRTITCKQIDL